MVEWAYFPRNRPVTRLGEQVVEVFESVSALIDSSLNNHLINVGYKDAASDVILSRLREGLEQIGFKVESGKKLSEKIAVPVLFKGGKPARSFHADAYHQQQGFVLEAGSTSRRRTLKPSTRSSTRSTPANASNFR